MASPRQLDGRGLGAERRDPVEGEREDGVALMSGFLA